jgi:hypothetical protein
MQDAAISRSPTPPLVNVANARELQPSRSGRRRRKTQRYVDPPPTLTSGLPAAPPVDADVSVPDLGAAPPAANAADFETPEITIPDPNSGWFRRYPHRPSVDPDSVAAVSAGPPGILRPESWFSGMTRSLAGLASRSLFAPLANYSQFRMMEWHYNTSSGKSNADTNRLLEMMEEPEFNKADVAGFRVEKGETLLDRDPGFAAEDGWHEATLRIPVPCINAKFPGGEEQAPHFEVPGFFYRRILPIIVTLFSTAPIGSLHFTPFEQWIRHANNTVERIYSELYNSQAWIDEHIDICRAFRSSPLEKVIAAVIWYSDSTHLTQFGTKSVWPIYMFFGNQSKYIRNKVSAFSAHHIGYIPSVSSHVLILHQHD